MLILLPDIRLQKDPGWQLGIHSLYPLGEEMSVQCGSLVWSKLLNPVNAAERDRLQPGQSVTAGGTAEEDRENVACHLRTAAWAWANLLDLLRQQLFVQPSLDRQPQETIQLPLLAPAEAYIRTGPCATIS
jgi:hypothetical protein